MSNHVHCLADKPRPRKIEYTFNSSIEFKSICSCNSQSTYQTNKKISLYDLRTHPRSQTINGVILH